MKQLKTLNRVLKIAALLSLGNLAQAKAENSIAITPLNLSHTQVRAEHTLRNISGSFKLNDSSPIPYFLKKEGRQKLVFDVSYKNIAAWLEKRTNAQAATFEGKGSSQLGPAFLEFKPYLRYNEFQEEGRVSLGIESRINTYFKGLFLKTYFKEETATQNHWHEYKLGATNKKRTILLGYRDHQTDSIEKLQHLFGYGEATISGLTLSGVVDKTITNGYFYGEGSAEYPLGQHQLRLTQVVQKDSSYPLEILSVCSYTYKSFSAGISRDERGKLSPSFRLSKDTGKTSFELSYGTNEITHDKRARELKLKISLK